jgi:hypothetical protein
MSLQVGNYWVPFGLMPPQMNMRSPCNDLVVRKVPFISADIEGRQYPLIRSAKPIVSNNASPPNPEHICEVVISSLKLAVDVVQHLSDAPNRVSKGFLAPIALHMLQQPTDAGKCHTAFSTWTPESRFVVNG